MKRLVRVLALGVAGAAAVATAFDQAAPPGAQSAPPPAAPSPAASPQASTAPLEDFVPSEKVDADDAVAFPVDI